MPKIEIDLEEDIFRKTKAIIDFLDWNIEQFMNLILQREIESLSSDPTNILQVYLDKEEILKLVFKE